MIVTKDEASSSAIIVKNAILARSGVYTYSHEEMVRRGHTPEVKKDFYTEYRPASVLVAAKEKFKYAVLTKEHPPHINSDNVQKVIVGVVGSEIDVVILENEEVALKGEVAFYTKDAVDYYNSGAKETSAQYISKVSAVSDQDYDYLLEDIQEIQGLALTRQGRGGSSVAVLDSLLSAGKSVEKNIKGDKIMGHKNSILSFLGIGKAPQDELSSLVMDNVAGYSELSEPEKKARRAKVDVVLDSLVDSPEKKVLVGTVSDCFEYSKEVIAKSEEVSKGLKSLYKICINSDSVELQATFDAIKADKEEPASFGDKADKEAEEKAEEKASKDAEEKEVKDAEEKEVKDKADKETKDKTDKEVEGTKDSLSLDATIAAIVSKVVDSLGPQIDKAVAKQLGTDTGDSSQTNDSVLPGFGEAKSDSSFLLKSTFS